MAKVLMVMDQEIPKTNREREIERKLSHEGPPETRVQVDPKEYHRAQIEKVKIQHAKAAESREARHKAAALKLDELKRTQEALRMLKRYSSASFDPVLQKKLSLIHISEPTRPY
eukprot:TRINITY_DN5032_c0_g1_i1.p2 TRINITY_DN5032_c0_g1~~TRINITY_DN5032_c0_g1_i1.p2  ORF type:complete len:114 (+),score=53.85 TRINITY_DN5032_c0_g1_i1:290-631(+)